MNNKVDLVYLWVDDTDKEWLRKKNSYLGITETLHNGAADDCRFHNNDELRYSLRSVEKYANWINKIFIVTDNQVPEWLNTNNPKIRIVDHTEIIPQDKLPLFNSCAIETRIPFIEDLSEYFLYANDDAFFWDKVDEDFFFKKEKPICRYEETFKKNCEYKEIYPYTISRAYDLVMEKSCCNFPLFYPHHNIDSYRKSIFIECINNFKEDFDETLNHRFRQYNDTQRIIVSFWCLSSNRMILKSARKNLIHKIFNIKSDSGGYRLKTKNIKRLLRANCKLMCINEDNSATKEDRKNLKQALETKFKEKSSFEK